MFALMLLVVVGSAVWVGFDGQSRDFSNHSFSKTAGGWVLGTILLWIVVFPMYVVARDKVPLRSAAPVIPPLPSGDVPSASSAPPSTSSNTVGASSTTPRRAVNPVVRTIGLAVAVIVGLIVFFAMVAWWPGTDNTVAGPSVIVPNPLSPISQNDGRDAQVKSDVTSLAADIESCLAASAPATCQAKFESEDVYIENANNYTATGTTADGAAMYSSTKSLGLTVRSCAGAGCASVTW